MFDVLIVGSGVSGVAAALRFAEQGLKPCLVDVGLKPSYETPIRENFYTYRKNHDSFSVMIGENFEGLSHLDREGLSVPAKLASPWMRFVTACAQDFSPVETSGFDVIQSFCQGGLASAWGAGLYRYMDRDLEGFPIDARDLAPYYDRLTKEIGISGANDDLTPYFGKDELLQKPLRPSANASQILRKYERKRERFNAKGVYIGRPRLGVLSEEVNGRGVCDYSNLEFWQPGLPHIYSPVLTMNKLIQAQKLTYQGGLLVQSWSRQDAQLIVQAERVKSGEVIHLPCKKLVLAAGAVGSARLVLQARKDTKTKLALLDNPALQFPFVIPSRIGAKLEENAFGLTQLNLVYDSEKLKSVLQGSLLEVTSPSRAEFFHHFPWAARDNLRLIRYVLPGLMVLQLFLPADASNAAWLGLNENGSLHVRAERDRIDPEIKNDVLKIFQRLGAYSTSSLVVEVPKGQSIHYAGTLPMRTDPKKEYSCNRNGELYGEPDVFVVDGSTFPALAAKNYSLALMANAMRIADVIAERLRSEA
jgi:choline dehydrogenase-like flavoprotein